MSGVSALDRLQLTSAAGGRLGRQISGEVADPDRTAAGTFIASLLRDSNRRRFGWFRRMRECQPSVTVVLRAVDNSEKLFLQLLGDRPAVALADFDAVDRANRSDFCGCSRKENFVGDVQHLTGDDRLD